MFDHPRAFERPEGEEEITPPYKQRSFDSLSVAHILQAKLDPTKRPSPLSTPDDRMSPPPSATSPDECNSPSIDSAAAMLSSVQQQASHDKAVDCLMSLASLASARPPPVSVGSSFPASHARQPSSGKKRQHEGGQGSSAEGGGASQAARRRLTMQRKQQAQAQAAASAAVFPPSAFGPAGMSAGMSALAHVALTPPSSLISSERVDWAAAMRHQLEGTPTISVAGVDKQIRLQSGATLTQLKLLAAAFKLCPNPTPEQIQAIANRVSVTSEKLETWFESRRSLDGWITSQPHLQPADVASMFFEASENGSLFAPSRDMSLPPSLPPSRSISLPPSQPTSRER